MSDQEKLKEEPSGDPILDLSQVEFSEQFFEAIDEAADEYYIRTGGRLVDWYRAVARAKLEGVVPLHGSGPRVMATIPHRGIVVTACYGDCLFRLDACNCNGLDHDMCSHPGADGLALSKDKEPPKECPMREATFQVVLAKRFCTDKDK